ncbi:helix-turn-helix domain-containing protein [Mycolicibacterium boenickei]|uniref:Helix-turn-helix domain-containing protein n=1 Tax=Mycolicibacterium boenickei TaxID=146017 RepID=A0AAX3A243_9MYCO|nr:helix-turn-helix domain-containing protein [Mycolicibacterium boenickei]PEG60043.1 excisionase [Mycolicibacterium boenickei]UNC01471.1 helix-turn-helix domain-containing protein [Mycolicibacterium boenickei]BBX91359.1 hypothetical protein MBOE_30080 [Mycolicibacterium boenickei]
MAIVPKRERERQSEHALITINEAAAFLRVHHRTIRKYIADGDLPAYHLGAKAVRLRRSDVEDLLTRVPVGWTDQR